MLSSILDPDPIPRRIWYLDRLDSLTEPLNPDGDLRGDGPPDFALRVPDGAPVFVWSWTDGTENRIALSEWTGSAWSSVELLTGGPQDLDPRVFIEADGTIYVAWWTPGPPAQVWLISRAAGASQWSAPALVSAGAGEEGRRPSVAVFDGSVYVAYERPSQQPGIAQDVVVSGLNGDGSFTPEVVGQTHQTAQLDAILHVAAGRFWIEWKQAAGEMDYASWDQAAGWGPPQSRSWPDGSWIGTELTRQRIRWAVLAP